MEIKRYMMLVMLGVLALPAMAQSNEIIDHILGQEKINAANGAYLVLMATDTMQQDGSPEAALELAKQYRWISGKKQAEAPLTLGEYSFLIMKAFKLSGGIMYTLFPSPRYASRELGYLGYVVENPGAYRYLSGKEAVSILGVILRERQND